MRTSAERRLVAAAVSSALVLPTAAQAVEFAVSGHVNRAVYVIDKDGHAKDGELQHVDANSSQSRFRFKGSEDLENGMTAGVNLELGVLSTGSKDGTTTRHAALYLDTAGGKLTLGHTSTAADGMAHADNAFNGGSWLAGVTNWCSYAGSGPACPTNDGGRTDILRYDTPAFGPARIAVSTGDDEYWDAKLSVAGSAGDAGYDLRIGYIAEYETDVDDDPQTTMAGGGGTTGNAGNGTHSHTLNPHTHALKKSKTTHTEKKGKILTTSAAVRFGQGTSLGVAWSQNDLPNDSNKEHEYLYAAVDHSYGDGSVGVYWKQGETSDSAGPNKEGTLWGVGLGHSIGGGATAYAGFRRVEEDDAKDLNLFLAGMRVTFN